MPNKRPGEKSGDRESRPRFVALYNAEVDSMAFKTLSPAAVWLLVQIRRAWRGSNEKIELPFSRVSWRLTFRTFDKARAELVNAGFIRIVKQGGLLKNPNVYALVDGWRGEVAKRLADDPQAGHTRNVRLKDGGVVNVWYPARRGKKAAAENWQKATAALAKKRKRAHPPAEKEPEKASEIPKLYANRIRVANLLENSSILRKGRAHVKTRELNDRN